MTTSEVKGMYFVSARQCLLARHGPEGLERVLAALPAETRGVMEAPLASHWYPEESLHHAIRVVWREVCQRDNGEFLDFMEACTRTGMKRFFRVLLGITTPSFLLKYYPTLFTSLRRGPARAEVDVGTDSASIRIADLPYAEDPLYQSTFVAGINVLFEGMFARRPRASVRHTGPGGLVLDIDWSGST